MRTNELIAAPAAAAGSASRAVSPRAPHRRAPPRRALLLRVIARAAAPHERATMTCFAPETRDDAEQLVDEREAEWIRLATKGDRDAFLALLATRGMTLAAARRGLADVVVTDAGLLPEWATDVLALFSELPGLAPHGGDAPDEAIAPFTLGELADAETLRLLAAEPGAPWTLHRIFEPLLHRGLVHLRAASDGAVFSPVVERQFIASLAQRLSGACSTTFYHTITVDDLVVDHPGSVGQTVHASLFGDAAPVLDQWARVFEIYPVLARLLAVSYRNWVSASAELLSRLDADRDHVQAAFSSGPLGELTACTLGIGDPHDHGRAVALLTFSSGTKAVYKPKDLHVVSAYMGLVRTLNDSGLTPNLPTRAVVHGDGYAWEEFVSERQCGTAEEVARFYVQMGMHIRLVQLLDGTDFTCDNLIAGGDVPALVDLEALLSPRIPVPRDGSDAAWAATVDASESPVRGCLVTVKILGERGRPAAELGALAPEAVCIAPFKQRMLRRTDDGLTLMDVYPEFPPSRASPWYDGARVRSTEHFADVVAGYVQMGAHLRRVEPLLMDDDGPLDAMRRVQVRCLCRDTHIYARMYQSSLTPARLRDAVVRELCLERMWQARFSDPAVVAAEIDALRDLDIPMFASYPSSTALLSGGNVLVASFFEGSASERLGERVAALSTSTAEHDREVIESVLFTLSPTTRRDTRVAAAISTTAKSATPEWMSIAERVGDEIIAASVGPVDDPAWVGANYHPWSRSWTFSALSDDLFSGTAGIGLVLAELAGCTASPRFANAALGTLRPLARRLARVPKQFFADPGATPPGAMFGWGGWVYACARGASALSDDGLGSAARTLFTYLGVVGDHRLSEILAGVEAWDVGTGVAGLLLVALAMEGPADPFRALVVATAGRLLAARNAATAMDDPPLYPPDGLPGAIVGVASGRRLALGRWTGDARAVTPICVACEGSQPESRTTGDLLAYLALARVAPHRHSTALGLVDARLALPARDDDGLEWLERGELALAAHRLGQHDRYLDIATHAGERLYGLKASTGRWLPERLLADCYNPSAFAGLGGIAHFFLQLAMPGQLRSYHTID